MDTASNSSNTCAGFEVMEVTPTKMDRITEWTKKTASQMVRSIQNKGLESVKRLLEHKVLIDVPLYKTGTFAGYTALHFACTVDNEELVELLIEDYQADVNVVANDGAQPIHLACLYESSTTLETLLNAGANMDAELGQSLFKKYRKDKIWINDFGDKMTILTFAVVYNRMLVASVLIRNNANLDVQSRKNKTLLMYAFENDALVGFNILQKSKSEEFINARDDVGFSAIHYILHPKKFGDYRYDAKEFLCSEDAAKGTVTLELFESGADIYTTVNGDPDTLPLNMAAYRSSAEMLKVLLPCYDDRTKSRPLYYATRPLEDPQKFLRIEADDVNNNEDEQWNQLERQRILSTELILHDLVNRRTFGLPVAKEEIRLMDDLVEVDLNVRRIVQDYKRDFIEGKLKSDVFQYGDERCSYYDFIMKFCNDRKILSLVRDQTIIDAHLKFFKNDSVSYYYFNRLFWMRINKAYRRVEMLNHLKTVDKLRVALPLPYELVLEIVEFLDNKDFETFLKAYSICN